MLDAAGGSLTLASYQRELDFDISGADRYVRVQATPNLSRGGTNLAEMAGVLVLGGADVNPTT